MELWDVYDENRKPLGYTVKREKFDSLNNEYHIVVHIWIKNSKGEYLIQKRSSNKKEGLKWAWTGGSVLMGENSIDGAVREVKEELGLTVDKEKLTLLLLISVSYIKILLMYTFIKMILMFQN